MTSDFLAWYLPLRISSTVAQIPMVSKDGLDELTSHTLLVYKIWPQFSVPYTPYLKNWEEIVSGKYLFWNVIKGICYLLNSMPLGYLISHRHTQTNDRKLKFIPFVRCKIKVNSPSMCRKRLHNYGILA